MSSKKRAPHGSLANCGLYEIEVPLSARQRTQVRRGLQKQRAVRLHVRGGGTGAAGAPGTALDEGQAYKFYLPYSDGARFMKRFKKGLGGRFTIIPNLQSHYSPAMLTAMSRVGAAAAPTANAGGPPAPGVVAVDTSGIVGPAVPSKKRSLTGRGGPEDAEDGGPAALPSDAEVMDEIEALTGETASKKKKGGKGVGVPGQSSGRKADPQKAVKAKKSTLGLGLTPPGVRAGDGIHIPGARGSGTGPVSGSGENFPMVRAAPPAQSSGAVRNVTS